jgi:hypothetical protein
MYRIVAVCAVVLIALTVATKLDHQPPKIEQRAIIIDDTPLHIHLHNGEKPLVE